MAELPMAEENYLCTPINEIPTMVNKLRDNFYSSTPTSLSYRINQLKQIIKFMEECEDDLINACIHYYGGSRKSHWLLRCYATKYDAYYYLKNLSNLMKSDRKSQSFPLNLMWSADLEYHPLGVVTIISPWNFPITLLLRPLVGAIASGNAVILKPSEITDKVSRVIHDKLLNYLDPNRIQIVCGGAAQTTALLRQKLDFCLFTGGGNIGKIVMKQCAANLTPCCLELGGKNPVIIDDDCDLDTTLKRIVWGRFDVNCGQICVAPEYILISKNKQSEAIKIIRKHLMEFYGDDGNTEGSDSYFNIVNDRHCARVNKLRKYYLENEGNSNKIVIGGVDDKEYGPSKVNLRKRHLPPMVLKDIDFNNDRIMGEEIFGPILSLIPMEGTFNEWIDDAIKYIHSKDRPLVAYIFSRQPKSKNILKLRNVISAGTICINDTINFMALSDVPFGGVGESGMGHYGGKYSFELFSQYKPIAVRSHGMAFLNKARYPNPKQGDEGFETLRKQFESFYPKTESTFKKVMKYSIAVAVIAFFVRYKLKKK